MKLSLKFPCLVVLLYCLIFSAKLFGKIQFEDADRPPPGFPSTSENQELAVSLFFMHQHRGRVYVALKRNTLHFHDPELILAGLKHVQAKQQILALLKEGLPLNMECTSNGMTALPSTCQALEERPLYIIYRPEEESVDLYLAPSFFKKPKKTETLSFIPESSASWSYLNQLGAAGSFSSPAPLVLSRIYPTLPNYYNLYSNNIWAYKNSSAIANISQNNGLNDGQHFQVQSLYAQHFIEDKNYLAGYIVNPISPFFQTQIIAGAGIRSTLETVKNADSLMASPLVLFVPQASQVSIFKNEQLIYSQFLEAGYQSINTNGFPEGGYELLIRIGPSNSERRFFSKGFALPPLHAPQWYVLGGYLTNGMLVNNNFYNFLPDILNVPFMQTGINKRMGERFAVLGDLLINSHEGLVDLGAAFYLKNSMVKVASLMGSKNTYGLYAMFNAQKNRINLNLIASKIFYQDKAPKYFFLNNMRDNNSLSLSYNLSDRDVLGLQANYTQSLDEPGSYNTGVFYQRRLGHFKGMIFFLNMVYNKAIYVGDTYSLNLTMNFSHNKLAGTESLAYQNQGRETFNNQFALPLVAQGSTVYSRQNEQGLGMALNEIHTLSSTVSSFAGTYNYTAHKGFAATYVNYNHIRQEGGSFGYGGNLETKLAMNQEGFSVTGLDRGDQAGLMLRVAAPQSIDEEAEFALKDDNNRTLAIFPANKKVFLSLPPFIDHHYTLVNLSRKDYHISRPRRHVTLYPGNIDYQNWRIEKRIIVMGRAIESLQGRPLANAWIHADNNGIFSDGEGYFQLELPEETTSLEADGPACHMALPVLHTQKAYLYLGDVPCS